MKILVINGPNLNRLGKREPSIYGTTTMDDCMQGLQSAFPEVEFLYYQSNVEGFLIDRLQAAEDEKHEGLCGIVFNAGAYTHTSIALRDCIASISVPVVEVHLSNVYAREEFRHHSMLAAVCKGVIAGFGIHSYRLAVEALLAK
jgi:3-dehydroquinate dehydratase-2